MQSELISASIPDLLPIQGRTLDIPHVSNIIRSLCIRLGHYQGSEEENSGQGRMYLGRALEHAISHQYALQYPDRYIQPGEIITDGIPGTLDLFDTWDHTVDEIKLTWMTERDNEPGSVKFWKYETQLKAYCHQIGVETGRLDVTFVNGDYKSNDAIRKQWRLTFTNRELVENWIMLRTHRDRMLREKEPGSWS